MTHMGVVTPKSLPEDVVYPKQQALIGICLKQKADDKQSSVYILYNRTRKSWEYPCIELRSRNFSISLGNRLSTGGQRLALTSRRCLRKSSSCDPDAVIVGAVHYCSDAPPRVIEKLLLWGCLSSPVANAPRRTRTYNPLIKSQLLCQLS